MTYGNQGQDIQIENAATVPVVTLMFIFAFVTAFAVMSTNRVELLQPHQLAQRWMDINAFHLGTMSEWWNASNTGNIVSDFFGKNWGKITTNLPVSSCASFTGWQLALNCYFLWYFGANVEQKMGGGRYLFLLLLAMFVPLLALFFFETPDGIYYYGPINLIMAVLGAAFLFRPPKEINTQWFKQTRGEIFVRQEKQDFTKKYNRRNIWLWIIFFIIYEAGSWYFSKTVTGGYMTFHWLPAMVAFIGGYGITAMMIWSATGSLEDGALKLMTIRKYNSILKLDVGHDVAIRGTSMAMGLPEERVQQWVMQQKGKMGIK